MTRSSFLSRSVLIIAFLALPTAQNAQQPKASTPASGTALTTAKAIELAELGRCKESLPTLRKALISPGPREERKKAGVLGVRCAMKSGDRTLR